MEEPMDSQDRQRSRMWIPGVNSIGFSTAFDQGKHGLSQAVACCIHSCRDSCMCSTFIMISKAFPKKSDGYSTKMLQTCTKMLSRVSMYSQRMGVCPVHFRSCMHEKKPWTVAAFTSQLPSLQSSITCSVRPCSAARIAAVLPLLHDSPSAANVDTGAGYSHEHTLVNVTNWLK